MTHAPDLHRGALVVTPDGRTAPITARQSGPITFWKVAGHFYREDQLRLPDEATPPTVRRCTACRGGVHCEGDGGVVIDGQATPCGCPTCGPDGRRSGACLDCGTGISRRAIRCRPCQAALAHEASVARLVDRQVR